MVYSEKIDNMRTLLLVPLLILGLWSCSDEKISFEIDMPRENISFQPIAGGAVMHYTLPKDKGIEAIIVRYKDAFGHDIVRAGSHVSNTLTLVGFNEAMEGVKAKVTLCDRNNIESEPLEVTFDTKKSGAVAFFDYLDVKPSWNGFMLTFDVPENANGMAHVFYVRPNQEAGESDTLLMNSFAIVEGRDTLTFSLKNPGTTNDVLIRTEDFRGYRVKEKIWKGIKAYNTAKLSVDKFDFEDPENLCVDDPAYKIGKKYLFDSDTKGENSFLADQYSLKAYLGGPAVVGRTMGIFTFDTPQFVAALRLYTVLKMSRNYPEYGGKYYNIFLYGLYLYDLLPCRLSVYASNDKENWKKIGTYEEDKKYGKTSWCYPALSKYRNTIDAVRMSDPVYLEVNFPATGESYKYLKVVVEELFEYGGNSPQDANLNQYMFLQELEIYTSKD